jgi:hypothetical protein
MGDKTQLPTDPFSINFREKLNHPEVVRVNSTINLIDLLGHTESWIIDTLRADGREVVFLQRSSAEEPLRLMLPSEVCAAIATQRDRITTRTRRLVAKRTVANRRAQGLPVGNPDALRKARKARRVGR